jgi:hypothetical protein
MLANTELTLTGGIFMICSIGAVSTLVFWCYKKILTNPDKDEPDLPGGLGP